MGNHLEDSILIQASPDELFAMVSDITRHGEWSEQTRACEWVDATQTGLGAEFLGHNHSEERGEWTTTSKVVEYRPGVRFAWQVGGGIVVWGYQFTPADNGTFLTQTWDLDRDFTMAVFTQRYGDPAIAEAEIDKREHNAMAGIPPTLERIKAIAEKAA